MAVMKKKGGKETPALGTSSLPDIIYMLLFFFMVTTVMREDEMKVMIKLPEATEISKLEKKSLVSYIYVGTPTKAEQAKWGDSPRIQLNGAYQDAAQIRDFVAAERDKLSESDRNAMTVSLKVDQGIRMGIINDIKLELRKADALKINYAAQKGLGRHK